MKYFKQILCIILFLTVVVTGLPVNAQAAEKTQKVRIYGADSWNDQAIEVEFDEYGESIDNIKTDSSNLVAKQTMTQVSKNNGSDDFNKAAIGLYAKKNGTYKVTYDIMNAKGKKKSSVTVAVYVYDYPLKSITYNGKNRNNNVTTLKSAKIKVALTSGNTVKKLEYGVYNSKGEMTYKSFKNGSKVTFGTKPYSYSDDYSSDDGSNIYKYSNEGMMAETAIRLTYSDKYTKQNEIITIDYIYCLAE